MMKRTTLRWDSPANVVATAASPGMNLAKISDFAPQLL